MDAQSLLVSEACAAEPARALPRDGCGAAVAVARRGPFRRRRGGAFLVEPRDDMEEEAPELKNAVAIPLSDARGLRYALAERVRQSMAVKKFAVTNELDVNVTLHWFDLEQEEGLRDHSPYKQVSFLEPGASTSLGTFVGHVFAVGDEEDDSWAR